MAGCCRMDGMAPQPGEFVAQRTGLRPGAVKLQRPAEGGPQCPPPAPIFTRRFPISGLTTPRSRSDPSFVSRGAITIARRAPRVCERAMKRGMSHVRVVHLQ